MTAQPPQPPGGGSPYPGLPGAPLPPGRDGGQQWTTPPPPARAGALRPIRTSRVFLGIGAVLLLNVLVALPFGIGLRNATAETASNLLLWLLIAQGVIFLGCMIAGILMISLSDRGIGIGVMIGWGIGALAMPVVGFGLCVAALQSATTA